MDELLSARFPLLCRASAAKIGDTYQINLANGSATSDGISTPVFIQTVSKGAPGAGAINSQKIAPSPQGQLPNTLLATPHRLAGSMPATLATPIWKTTTWCRFFKLRFIIWMGLRLGSDLFDAMDSSNGKDKQRCTTAMT